MELGKVFEISNKLMNYHLERKPLCTCSCWVKVTLHFNFFTKKQNNQLLTSQCQINQIIYTIFRIRFAFK